MRLDLCFVFSIAVVGFLTTAPVNGEDPVLPEVTLETVTDPGPNASDEPFATEHSVAAAAGFLDRAALTWQKDRKCFSCHTNFLYLYARPGVSADTAAHRQVRAFAEELVEKRWPEHKPRWDAEVVAAAAALAFNDAATTGKLHPTTRTALDRMWTVQKEDGGWDWLKCGWPPMESDDHYGVTLAAIAAGVAPEEYASTPAARKGIEGIRGYLKTHEAPTLHHRAMVLWAASYLPDLVTAEQKDATIADLLKLQKSDGGWAVATLGTWERADGGTQDLENSDGYGTAFVTYVLRQAGVDADSEPLQKSVAWLKSHQRQSGRWYTRSLNRDNKHFLSHAGTAMALMAIRACETQQVGSVSKP
jgi:squalene-hopene/tetraprenyl-beta-curcumene cyclase